MPQELDALGLYMREINEYSLLTAEEEHESAKAIWQGHEAARKLAGGAETPLLHRQVEAGAAARRRLIQCNSFLVVNIARRYSNPDFSLPDLIQEGNVGLLRAVDKFDHRRGTRFSTYATYWIRQMISRYIGTQRYAVRLPSHQAEALTRYRRVQASLMQEDAQAPSLESIAYAMNISMPILAHLLRITQPSLSLETPLNEHERPLGDTLDDQGQQNVEQQVSERMLSQAIHQVLATLSARESRILELRFGLRDGAPRTLEAIGQRFGLTKERVRQIEVEALNKLRHPRRASLLHSYMT
ncbi:MAG: sigma-70 family RNA polymerase sigma factor [Ardenticatenales bacterium]|nr:sigma-70 family RNA polymerase sigma factor [Ardenticatenales bacterium]